MKKILLSSFIAFGIYANAQVSVTATSGTATATYTTLKGAFDAINDGTHQGSINLSITANTTETASAVLNAATTYSAVFIKPSTNATISGSIDSNPLVKILGSNVTIDGSTTSGGTTRDLTFSNTSAIAPSVFFMGSPTSTAPMTNVTVKNSVLVNGSTASTNFILANGASAAGYFNNVTIQNNDIKTGFNGLFVLANTGTGNGNNLLVTGNTVNTSILQNAILLSGVAGTSTVSNNTISAVNPNANAAAVGAIGINLAAGTNNASVFGNTISVKNTAASGLNYATGINIGVGAANVSTKVYNNTITEVSGFLTYVNSSAIYLTGASPNVSIYSNKISGLKNTNPAAPIQAILLGSTSTAANVLAYNNVISDIQGTSGGQVAGIYAFAGAGYKVYNNTVNLNTSNSESGLSASFYAIGTLAANAVDLRNNIFVNNKTSGSRYAIYSAGTSAAFSNINYNNYYTTGSALGFVGSAARTTLADIQTGFGGNVNSLALSPVFVSATDLHLRTNTNAGLDNKGLTLAEVTTDFDGTTRGAAPDMGAYEFTYVVPAVVPNCTTISAPTLNATNVAPNPATITWTTSDGASGYKLYLGTTSGGTDVLNGTILTGTSYTASLLPNTNYFAKVVAYNTVGDATGCSEVPFTTGNYVYCVSGGTIDANTGLAITRVVFSGLDKTSARATYEDFSTSVPAAVVDAGKTYTISITNGSTTGFYTGDVAYVWIDYNKDGTLSDTTERTTVTVNAVTSTASVTIPQTAGLGITRMRVRYSNSGGANSNTACGTATYGEVEDYSVDIKEFLAVSDVNKASISVYPNPFTDVLKISDVKGVKSISVNDMTGRQVKSLAPSAEINLSSLNAGLYIVNLQMEDGSVKTFKAIKK